MNYTPGPWNTKHQFNVMGESHGVSISVASCGGWDTNMFDPTEEQIANAQLIAAAPDMYEALKPFAEFACDDWETHQCHNCKAKRALDKAEGKECKLCNGTGEVDCIDFTDECYLCKNKRN